MTDPRISLTHDEWGRRSKGPLCLSLATGVDTAPTDARFRRSHRCRRCHLAVANSTLRATRSKVGRQVSPATSPFSPHKEARMTTSNESRDYARDDEHAAYGETLAAAQAERFGGMKAGSAFFGWLSAMGMAVILTAILAAA